MSGIKSAFKQTKKLPSLGLELNSNGHLVFRKPDYLEWLVTSGGEIKFVFDKDEFSLYEAGQLKSKISLKRIGKGMAGPIKHLRAWLKMDIGFVKQNYKVSNIGAGRFRFIPKVKNKIFKKIEITTNNRQPISQMTLFELSGDELKFEFIKSKVSYEK